MFFLKKKIKLKKNYVCETEQKKQLSVVLKLKDFILYLMSKSQMQLICVGTWQQGGKMARIGRELIF